MAQVIRIRRGTQQQWESSTRILQLAELALNTSNNKLKVGNGGQTWSQLPYINVLPSEVVELIQDTIGTALDNEFHDGIEIEYNDDLGKLIFSVSDDVVRSSELSDYVGNISLGAPSGVATLDEEGLIPDSQISTNIARSSEIPATTDDLQEGSLNLYFSGKDTDDLSEGSSNKYFSDSLARTALSADTNGTEGGIRIIAPDAGDVSLVGHEATHSVTVQSDGIAGVTNSKVIIKGSAEVIASSSINDPGDLSVAGEVSANSISAGSINITGNLTVGGTTTTVNANDLSIQDPLIYLSNNQYSTNILDIGFIGAYGPESGTEENHLHTGLVKDVTDGKWKLFSNVPHPISNEIDFTDAEYDDFKAGGIDGEIVNVTRSLNVIADPLSVDPSDYIFTIVGSDESEVLNVKSTGIFVEAPISFNNTVDGLEKSDVGLGNVDNTSDEDKYKNEYVSTSATSLTLSSASHKFKVIEFTSGSPISVTIPNDTQDSGWQIGSYVEVRQVGGGQITVNKDGAVTYNAPDNQFKTRVQWSSLFIEKRAANTWLVTGDATA